MELGRGPRFWGQCIAPVVRKQAKEIPSLTRQSQSSRFKCLRPSSLDFLVDSWILYHGFYSIFI